ncbi:MAG TPA: NIPSNAP family containing protein [Bacteroidales bacterium]|nr:NIPSNAP family containing protein [Bacteroidales bacterium]
MKKINLSSIIFALAILLVFSFSATAFAAPPDKQMFYELKIYRLTDPGKNAVFDRFLKDAYIPAMHRAGIPTVGVFKPVETDTAFGKMVYVFVPYKTIEQFDQVFTKLEGDAVYKEAGKEFLDAPYNDPPFSRYESVLMKAFAFMPEFRPPSFSTPKSERIYELRSYGSWTEEKATRKIHMFNEGGEIAVFEEVGSKAAFYGQVVVGSQRPRLMYMTTYENMESQKEHWAAFSKHPAWQAMRVKEEYANTLIKALPYLLHPTDYSDF